MYIEHYFGNSNEEDKKRQKQILKKARFIIDCNKIINKNNNSQVRVHLTHGMPIKSVPEYFCGVGRFDYITVTSEIFGKILARDTHNKKSTVITLGLARDELMLNKSNKMNKLFEGRKFKKVIIWLPTYRQRVSREMSLKKVTPLGIPAIENINNLRKLNEELQKEGVLLVLKPHPVQDTSVIKTEKLSNFIIIGDKDIQENDIKLYELLGLSDALITDYSSVYVDYLLLDKPIGITTDDINAYKDEIGFVFENVFDILKGEYIENTEQMISFIKNVANNNDIAKKERNTIKEKLHKNLDFNASERIYKFLKEKENL